MSDKHDEAAAAETRSVRRARWALDKGLSPAAQRRAVVLLAFASLLDTYGPDAVLAQDAQAVTQVQPRERRSGQPGHTPGHPSERPEG